MTAFNQAWEVIKMPAKGWECPNCKMPMMVEDTRGMHLECMNCGATAIQPARRGRNQGYGEAIDEMLDEHKAASIARNESMTEELRATGHTVMDKPKKKVDYEPHKQFSELQMILNELGFTSVEELLNDYLRLRAATMNTDLRSMGLVEESDQMDQEWTQDVLNRNKLSDDPFISQDRGEAW